MIKIRNKRFRMWKYEVTFLWLREKNICYNFINIKCLKNNRFVLCQLHILLQLWVMFTYIYRLLGYSSLYGYSLWLMGVRLWDCLIILFFIHWNISVLCKPNNRYTQLHTCVKISPENWKQLSKRIIKYMDSFPIKEKLYFEDR